MFTQYAPLEKRIERAFRARVGFKPNSLDIEQVSAGRHVATNPATGHWIEFDTSAWRIRRLSEGRV